MSCLSNIQEIWNMSCLSLCDTVFYIVYDIVYDVVDDIVYDVVYNMLVLPVGFSPGNDARRCWRGSIAPWASCWTGLIPIWCHQTCKDDHGPMAWGPQTTLLSRILLSSAAVHLSSFCWRQVVSEGWYLACSILVLVCLQPTKKQNLRILHRIWHRIWHSRLTYDVVSWPTMSYPDLRCRIRHSTRYTKCYIVYDIVYDIVGWPTMSYSDLQCRILTYDVVYDIVYDIQNVTSYTTSYTTS